MNIFRELKSKTKRIEQLDASVEELERKRLTLLDQVAELKSDNKQLALDKKISEEDIRHMLKMGEERTEIEKEKYKLTCDAEKAEAITKVRDEYRDKIEAFLKGQIEDNKKAYESILDRLPDVNVKLRGDLNK